jgi:G3E family GTPase
VIQKVEVAKRRERLQGRINVWNRSAEQYLHADEEVSLEDLFDQDDANHAESMTEHDTEGESEAEAENVPDAEAEATDIRGSGSKSDEGSPENMDLFFPSSFLLHRFPNQGEKELSLRQGQANDTLHLLRIALGKKSFLFRSHVRAAKSQQRKTRAWAEVSAVDGHVRQLARVYVATRQKMITLGADAIVLDRYKVLRHSDLRISTAIATPNARGQRNVHMAWFWTMDMTADTDTDGWMEECRCITLK